MKLPNTLQTEIILRFMSEKDLDAFEQAYHDAKLRHAYNKPTKEQRKIANYTKKHGMAAAAKYFKKTSIQVDYAVKRVSSYDFLTS